MNLAAEYVLIATNEDGRRRYTGGFHGYGVAGATLMEMVLQGAVAIERKRVHPIQEPDGPIMTSTWQDIQRHPGKHMRHWIHKWGHGHRFRWVQELLVEAGVLRKERRKVLGLFPTTRYPEVDPEPERALRERLRVAIEHNDPRDVRTVALALLLAQTDLLGGLTDARTMRQVKRTVTQWRDHPALQGSGRAVADAINELVAAIVAVTAASTAAHVS